MHNCNLTNIHRLLQLYWLEWHGAYDVEIGRWKWPAGCPSRLSRTSHSCQASPKIWLGFGACLLSHFSTAMLKRLIFFRSTFGMSNLSAFFQAISDKTTFKVLMLPKRLQVAWKALLLNFLQLWWFLLFLFQLLNNYMARLNFFI